MEQQCWSRLFFPHFYRAFETVGMIAVSQRLKDFNSDWLAAIEAIQGHKMKKKKMFLTGDHTIRQDLNSTKMMGYNRFCCWNGQMNHRGDKKKGNWNEQTWKNTEYKKKYEENSFFSQNKPCSIKYSISLIFWKANKQFCTRLYFKNLIVLFQFKN